MNKDRKIRFKNWLSKRKSSITVTMFALSFATIVVVLLIGSLIIGVIAPRLYSNSVMNEIERNLIATIEYYNIELSELDFATAFQIPSDGDTSFKWYDAEQFFSPETELDDLLSNIQNEDLKNTINVHYLFGSIAMSRGATITITDMDNNLVYQTPSWFSEHIKGVRFPGNQPKNGSGYFLIKNNVEANSWVTRSTTLYLDKDYILTVKLDLRTFNQNIMIFNKMFFFLIGVGGLFAIIFSIILSFIVTKPLKELKKIASAMESLEFSIRYDKSRNDEIGQLGKTLNHMMDRLGTNINKLEAELQKEKRTDKLRKEFVAQVSHELKTPVAIVSNYTEALLDGVADTKEEQDSYLTIIENECRKMGHIINDLLDLSQMEAGTFNIHKSEFDFKYLLEDLIGKYDNEVMGKYDFITETKIKSAVMYGDELRIEQAISNLLSNALKHTKEGGYIKLTAAQENKMIHIQVENEGEPIDSKLLIHIWDSFTKGADEKGAGLGLSITRSIVELHNGEYYVQNLENSVIFGIRLPLL